MSARFDVMTDDDHDLAYAGEVAVNDDRMRVDLALDRAARFGTLEFLKGLSSHIRNPVAIESQTP